MTVPTQQQVVQPPVVIAQGGGCNCTVPAHASFHVKAVSLLACTLSGIRTLCEVTFVDFGTSPLHTRIKSTKSCLESYRSVRYIAACMGPVCSSRLCTIVGSIAGGYNQMRKQSRRACASLHPTFMFFNAKRYEQFSNG